MPSTRSHAVKRSTLAGTVGILALVICVPGARSDDDSTPHSAAAPEFFPPPTAAEQRYEKALEEPISISFNETPLAEALTRLSEQAGVPIQLDSNIQKEFADTVQASALNFDFQDCPLRSILERINLNAADLETPPKVVWYVADDGITLTLQELAYYGVQSLMRRIYPVGDLCETDSEAEQLVELLKSSTGTYWKTTSADGSPGLLVSGIAYSVKDDNDIYAMMAFAGSITYLDSIDGLVVQTDRATHADVLAMLRMLRQAKQAFKAGSLKQRTATGGRLTAPDTEFTLTDEPIRLW